MAARMWTSFVTDLDPNGHGGECTSESLRGPLNRADLTCVVPHIPQWPEYSSKKANFVFRLPRNENYVEADTYRVEGMEVINRIAR